MADTNKVPTVAEFMTTDPCMVDEGLPLADALERMSLNNIRHLIVSHNGKMTGIVSNRDVGLAAALPGVNLKKTEVAVAATEQPYTCAPDAPVHEVAREMEAHRIGCVVVQEGGDLTGIFTTTDALRALRQIATGEIAARLSPPTHHMEEDRKPTQTRYVHAVDALGRGARPSANQGKFGGGPV